MNARGTSALYNKVASQVVCGLAIAGSTVVMGCGVEDLTAKPTGDGTLVVLGDPSSADSAIARVASGLHAVAPEALGLMNEAPSAIGDTLAATRGIAFDMAQASAGELAGWQPLIAAAMQRGVPVIIEHATDRERLAATIGIGVTGDLVMVTSDGPNRHRVQAFGNSAISDAFAEFNNGDDGSKVVLPAAGVAVDAAVAEIRDSLRRDGQFTARAAVTPTNGYHYYLVDFPELHLALTPTQTAILDLDFEAELALDRDRGFKVLLLRPAGSGQHPGTLADDGGAARGYYQESIAVDVAKSDNTVALYAHEPSSPNNVNTFTSSTGWSIGASVGSDGVATATVGYSESSTVTTSLPDFTVINDTAGQEVSFKYGMTTTWDHMFNQPTFKACNVKGVPPLAKSNLKPAFEAMYRAPASYSGLTSFTFSVATLFRHVDRSGSNAFVCHQHTHWTTYTRSQSLVVGFGAI